jgi:hypothetical protein
MDAALWTKVTSGATTSGLRMLMSINVKHTSPQRLKRRKSQNPTRKLACYDNNLRRPKCKNVCSGAPKKKKKNAGGAPILEKHAIWGTQKNKNCSGAPKKENAGGAPDFNLAPPAICLGIFRRHQRLFFWAPLSNFFSFGRLKWRIFFKSGKNRTPPAFFFFLVGFDQFSTF